MTGTNYWKRSRLPAIRDSRHCSIGTLHWGLCEHNCTSSNRNVPPKSSPTPPTENLSFNEFRNRDATAPCRSLPVARRITLMPKSVRFKTELLLLLCWLLQGYLQSTHPVITEAWINFTGWYTTCRPFYSTGLPVQYFILRSVWTPTIKTPRRAAQNIWGGDSRLGKKLTLFFAPLLVEFIFFTDEALLLGRFYDGVGSDVIKLAVKIEGKYSAPGLSTVRWI